MHRAGVRSRLAATQLARTAAAALVVAGAPRPAALTLILSNDDELAALNSAHMGDDDPTDVLSFPLLPPSAFPAHRGQAVATGAARATDFVSPPGRRTELGDVIVSVERAAAQARDGRGGQTGDVRWSVEDELRLLVVHGTLHMCGWDHALPAEEAAMRDLERQILESLR
jgi:probable rRNA maturation factor